jgi:hypothetical protein
MAKQKKGKSSPASSKSSGVPYTLVLGIAAIVAAAAIYFFSGRNSAPSSAMQQQLAEANSEYLAKNPGLRNRLILPAVPHATRPVTLPPEAFSDDEVRRSYQAAKDNPDALESISCYCGCYGEGHRNNLDCFKDNHGIT